MRKINYQQSLQLCKDVLKYNNQAIEAELELEKLQAIYGRNVIFNNDFSVFFRILDNYQIKREDYDQFFNTLTYNNIYTYCLEYNRIQYPYQSKKNYLYFLFFPFLKLKQKVDQLELDNTDSLYRYYFPILFAKLISHEELLYKLLFQDYAYLFERKFVFYFPVDRIPIERTWPSINHISSVIYSLFQKENLNTIAKEMNAWFNQWENQFIVKDDIFKYKAGGVMNTNFYKVSQNDISNKDFLDLLYPFTKQLYELYSKQWLKKCTRGYKKMLLFYIYFHEYFSEYEYNEFVKKSMQFVKKGDNNWNYIRFMQYLQSDVGKLPDKYMDQVKANGLLYELN